MQSAACCCCLSLAKDSRKDGHLHTLRAVKIQLLGVLCISTTLGTMASGPPPTTTDIDHCNSLPVRIASTPSTTAYPPPKVPYLGISLFVRRSIRSGNVPRLNASGFMLQNSRWRTPLGFHHCAFSGRGEMAQYDFTGRSKCLRVRNQANSSLSTLGRILQI